MYPLERMYGPNSYRAFLSDEGRYDCESRKKINLTSTKRDSLQICDDDPIAVGSFRELIHVVSFFGVMNKRHTLFFRGQSHNFTPIPTLFRNKWRSITGREFSIPSDHSVQDIIFRTLNSTIREIVIDTCMNFPMPRRATLTMFREAVWAVAQHYELWPTPLIDVTPNLRVAASFALWGGCSVGHVYIVALPPSTNSITYDADQHTIVARLSAVCPHIAKRPHYQDGYLVGRFPFDRPSPNEIDRNPKKASDLQRRLVARIELRNNKDFWSADFPAMSRAALLPEVTDDVLFSAFMRCQGTIDDLMGAICKGT